jgi:hypothetical protein
MADTLHETKHKPTYVIYAVSAAEVIQRENNRE